MTQLGKHRDPSIRREERNCNIHGRTTFASYTSGGGKSNNVANIQWRCMSCDCDRDAEYRRRIASGEHVPVPRAIILEPTHARQCSECFVELGAREEDPCGECRSDS